MSSKCQQYSFNWNNHGNDLSFAFKDLLEQKELIDVTLVADGYLFNAHRLILSAVSPYFRQMFAQMPDNRKAYVFMADVSKETLENLITFIYFGEVNIQQDSLADFLKTAEALKIRCLADGNLSNALPIHNQETGPSSSCGSVQYQSSQIHCVQCPITAHTDLKPTETKSTSYDHQSIANMSGNDEIVFDAENNSSDFGDSPQHAASIDNNNSLNNEYDIESFVANELIANSFICDVPAAKRLKRNCDRSDYNIVAGIQTNNKGNDNLFYGGHKFTKHSKYRSKQRWQCTRRTTQQCSAAVSTINMNGITMMKVLEAEHSHEVAN